MRPDACLASGRMNLGEAMRAAACRGEAGPGAEVGVRRIWTVGHVNVVGLGLKFFLDRGDEAGPVLLSRCIFKDSSTDNQVELLRIRNMVDVAQSLVSSGRLDDKVTISEHAAGKGSVKAHVGDLAQRHHRDTPGEEARGQ